jgi:hypothetical protein
MTLKRGATPGKVAAIVAAVGLAAAAAAVAVPALASATRPGTASVPDITAPGGMPRLTLIRTQSGMTVQGYPTKRGSKNVQVFLDPGIWLAALGAPLVIDVGRTAYNKPITVTQVLTSPDGKRTTRRLSNGLLDGWKGIKDMVTLTVRNSAGKTVALQKETACLGSYNVARAAADSPDSDPYPEGCGVYDPFPLGAVWGLPKNWAFDPTTFGTPLNLVAGQTYTLTETIPKTVAQIFHVSAKDATSSLKLKVTAIKLPPPPTASPTPTKTATAKATASSSPTPTVSVKASAAADGRPRTDTEAPVYQLFSRSAPAAHRPASPLPALPAVPEMKNPTASVEPDLVPLPAWGMNISTQAKHDYLNFSATVWVGGNGPLDVEAFRQGTNPVMPAYQYFYKDGKIVGRVRAGTMGFDSAKGHNHWHFEQFAAYQLLGANKKLIVRSQKVGFCIAPTDAVDMLVHGALWQPNYIGLQGQCGSPTALWVRELMPVGWGDTYSQSKAGQAFDITSLPNGKYYVEVIANPEHVLKEVSDHNDVSYRAVILSGTKGHRHFRVLAYDGINPERG